MPLLLPLLIPTTPLPEALRPLPFVVESAYTLTQTAKSDLPGQTNQTVDSKGELHAAPKGTWWRQRPLDGDSEEVWGAFEGRPLSYTLIPDGFNEDSGVLYSPDTLGADFGWGVGDPILYGTQAGDGRGWAAILKGYTVTTRRTGDTLEIDGKAANGYTLSLRLSGDGRRLIGAAFTRVWPGMTDSRGLRATAWTEVGGRAVPTRGEFFNVTKLPPTGSMSRTEAFSLTNVKRVAKPAPLPIPEGMKFFDMQRDPVPGEAPTYQIFRNGHLEKTSEVVRPRSELPKADSSRTPNVPARAGSPRGGEPVPDHARGREETRPVLRQGDPLRADPVLVGAPLQGLRNQVVERRRAGADAQRGEIELRLDLPLLSGDPERGVHREGDRADGARRRPIGPPPIFRSPLPPHRLPVVIRLGVEHPVGRGEPLGDERPRLRGRRLGQGER